MIMRFNLKFEADIGGIKKLTVDRNYDLSTIKLLELFYKLFVRLK